MGFLFFQKRPSLIQLDTQPPEKSGFPFLGHSILDQIENTSIAKNVEFFESK
jgi:hypothetical protein